MDDEQAPSIVVDSLIGPTKKAVSIYRYSNALTLPPTGALVKLQHLRGSGG